jgi:hypothetical protein
LNLEHPDALGLSLPRDDRNSLRTDAVFRTCRASPTPSSEQAHRHSTTPRRPSVCCPDDCSA